MMLPWKSREEFIEAAEGLTLANKIIAMPPIKEHLIDTFCVEKEWRDNIELELDSVIGSVHPDYQGRSWLWLLKKGKRMKGNLDLLLSNPGYYFTTQKKLPSMSYLQIDGRFYVYCDGNHRTCIAKLLFPLLDEKPVLSGVEIYRKRLDFEAYRAWKKLGGPEGKVFTERRKLSREDGSGWMREYFELRFMVFKGKRCYRNLTSNELIELSRERERSFLSKVRTGIKKLFRY